MKMRERNMKMLCDSYTFESVAGKFETFEIYEISKYEN